MKIKFYQPKAKNNFYKNDNKYYLAQRRNNNKKKINPPFHENFLSPYPNISELYININAFIKLILQ